MNISYLYELQFNNFFYAATIIKEQRIPWTKVIANALHVH